MEQFRFLQIVSDTVDSKTPWTANHSKRVERFSAMIGNFMRMGQEELRALSISSRLHDIGKIGVNDTLLEKPHGLTAREFESIQKHTLIGCDLFNSYFLDMLDFGVHMEDSHMVIKEILPVIRHHHERVDGTGYPDGLKGREISIFARIVSVADAVDAMIVDRPYRRALGIDYALSELKRCRNTQFDPEIVDIFMEHFEPGMMATFSDMLNHAYPPEVNPTV